MGMSVWTRRPLPAPCPDGPARWQAQPEGVAGLPGLRRRVRAAVAQRALPAGCDDGERLLLVVEELVSNALRHGRPPVHVSITAAHLGWLVAVSDVATDRPPLPALYRDPARGGMGLSLVARLCACHGWAVEDDVKSVWAQVPYLERPRTERVQEAVARARLLAGHLAEIAARTAESLDALASGADAAGRPAAAGGYRSGAARALSVAERARWAVLGGSRPPAGRPAG
jgi:anti-sigma regulatory factor (Ser/Thr protein kinase)